MNAYEFILRMRDMASSQLRQVASSVGLVDNNLRNTQNTANGLGGAFGKLKNVLAGVFATVAISAFVGKVVEARSEYEKFNAVLTNTFGSADVGAGALKMLSDFAAKTPFQLNELTGSFVKLVNRGFNPTRDEMIKLGDLASSQGKGFDQLTEALLDAQTGEFERLKEFGIKASKSGNMVSLSFKGITKEIANNETAIRNAIMEYGELNGVAGGMAAISETLGGKISNLGDQWNMFLVAVGGESGAIFTGVISLLSTGLAFLTEHLPYISAYFDMLWQTIEPLVTAFKNWITSSLGVSSLSDAMNGFKNIMLGVLTVVDFVVTGAMTPLGQVILSAVGFVIALKVAFAILNFVMAMNPVSLIIIGIITLIGIIGIVSKYTSGFGTTWKAVVNGSKLIWQTFTDYTKANFNTLVNGLMIGIDKIKIGWYKFKEALGLGDSGTNQQMISQLNNDVEARKKSIADGYKKMADSASKAKQEFSKVGLTFDTKGMKNDFEKLKNNFKGLGGKEGSTSAYDEYLKSQDEKNQKGKEDKVPGHKDKQDSIVSGGAKMTHITINIDKIGTDTKIFVDNATKGVEKMGDMINEAILRAVNSVNQMQ